MLGYSLHSQWATVFAGVGPAPTVGGWPTRWGEMITMGGQSVEGLEPPAGGQSPADREVDIELLAFVERYATGPVKWELITFFGENPYTRDTAFDVASRIGRDTSIVLPELGDLVMLGLLEQTRINGETVYHLTQEPSLRRMTFRFVHRFGLARVRRPGWPPDPSKLTPSLN